jgi:Lhr-like helicase
VNELVERALAGTLDDQTHVVYVSPLKALGNDIQKNLQVPLAGIRARAEAAGAALPEIRVAVRSGDTPVAERAQQLKRPPHILITTPESLYILLTAEKSRALLRGASTVIVDEIHAVAADKRGHWRCRSSGSTRSAAGGRCASGSATVKPLRPWRASWSATSRRQPRRRDRGRGPRA